MWKIGFLVTETDTRSGSHPAKEVNTHEYSNGLAFCLPI